MTLKDINLNLTYYSDKLKKMMKNLMNSDDSTDVTILCEDKTKLKAHKFVLCAFSPVFNSVINDLPKTDKSVIYLRGVLSQEMNSILKFMYLGQATLYQERVNEFLNVAKNFEIEEISKGVGFELNSASETHEDNDTDSTLELDIFKIKDEIKVMSKEAECDLKSTSVKHEYDDEYIIQLDREKSNGQHEQKENLKESTDNLFPTDIIVTCETAGLFICSNCDKQFTRKSSLERHIKSSHEGIKYPCNKCDKTYANKVDVKNHVKSVHEGVKFQCEFCDFTCNFQASLSKHMKIRH